MSRFRELKQIVQRAEHYETDTDRKLRLRAEAEVMASVGSKTVGVNG